MIIYQKYIKREDLRANPTVLYVFGDNEARTGLGGQAKEMRGEPNAVGIATKASPWVFWDETDLSTKIEVIDRDMVPLFVAASKGRTLIFPLDGVGTGLSELQSRCPNIFFHLKRQLYLLEKAVAASQWYV
jgi:hypothetical protein